MGIVENSKLIDHGWHYSSADAGYEWLPPLTLCEEIVAVQGTEVCL